MSDFANYTIKALRQELRKRELYTEGNKSTLLLRLKNHIEREQMNQGILQPNAAEFLADIEISTEQADSVNEENANSTERETEQLANESIQQELESVRQKLDSTKHEKNLLQQEHETLKRKYDVLKHDYDRLKQRQDQSIPLSPEVRPSTSRVTSTTSRDVPYEFNRRNNYDRCEELRYRRTEWRNQAGYERNRRGRRY